MPFTDRFQLLGLKRDEGACSFEAREIANGRPVLVHLFADRTTPLNRALLAKVAALPPSERSRIIDRGEHEGGVYIVTDRLAEYPGLHEWLRAKHTDRARPVDEGGAWRMNSGTKPSVDDQLATLFDTAPTPVVEPSPLDAPRPPMLTDTGEVTLLLPLPPAPPAKPAPPVLRPAAPAKEPGEFTRIFAPRTLRPAGPASQPPPLASKVEKPPAASSVETPPTAPTTPASQSGAFTREFAAPVPRPGSPLASKVEMPPAGPAPPPNHPGEFTREFAAPVLWPAAPAVPRVEPPMAVSTPAANQPGEFTREFAPPVMRPAAPAAPTAEPPMAGPIPAVSQPGEFTREFASPVLRAPAPAAPGIEPPPVAKTPPKEPGEFTRLFAPPVLRPAAPAAPRVEPPASSKQPGEFTQQFVPPVLRPTTGAPRVDPLPAANREGEFTRQFAAVPSPAQAAPQAPPKPAPGEFTKQFELPAHPVPRPATRSGERQAPGQPGSGQQAPGQQPGEFTQMLQAQRQGGPATPANQSSTEFTSFFESPMAPAPLGSPPHIAPMMPPPSPPKSAGEFTQVFGRDALPSAPPPPAIAAPPPSSSGNATQVFNAQRPAPAASPATPASSVAPQGPGEYTRMFAKPAGLTFGQAPAVPQAPHQAPAPPIARNSSRLPMLLLIGGAVLLILAAVVYFVMRPHT